LTSHLERIIVSKKLIEDDLSQVEKSVTKFTYKLGVDFERCEDKGGKSAHKFIPSSSYHQEEKAIKSTKTHYPSNPKSFFNLKREVRKETPKSRQEAFVCMFCGRTDHLDEFYFRHKRIEKRCFNYARNSYCDESMDLTIAHTILVHKKIALFLDALVTTRVLIVVIASRLDPVFLLEDLRLTLSPDTWTVHVFPVVVHVPLGQVMMC
jgi:hypothetical protein